MKPAMRQIRRFLQDKRRAKAMRNTMTVLAVLVIFVTTYALVLPAVTIDKDTAATEAGLVLEDAADNIGAEAAEEAAEAKETKAPETEAEPEEEPETETEAPAESSAEGVAGIATVGGDSANADEVKAEGAEEAEEAGDAKVDPGAAAAADEKSEEPAAEESDAKETTAPKETEPQIMEGELTYELNDVIVTVSFDKEAGIPKGAKLAVEEITEKSNSYDYDAYTEKAEEAVLEKAGDKKEMTQTEVLRLFDIKILLGDQKVDLNDKVKVKIACKTPMTVAEDMDLHTVHFVDDKKDVKKLDVTNKKDIEILATETKTGKTVTTSEGTSTEVKEIKFDTNGFSVYGIVGTEPITVDFITADGRTLRITLTPDEKTKLPNNAALEVTEIDFEDPEWNARSVQLAAALFDKYGNVTISDARFLSVRIMVDGKEYKLKVPAEVKVEYTDALVTEDLAEYHYDDDAGKVMRPDPEEQVSHFAVISYTDEGSDFLMSTNTEGSDIEAMEESTFKADSVSDFDIVYVYEYTAPSAD